MKRTGNNTGNLLIGHGLFSNTVAQAREVFPGFNAVPPEEIHKRFDMVFIPAANFISRGADFGEAYEYFRRTKLPIFCCGLGAQIEPGTTPDLKPGLENFLRLISERSGSIGVRGSFTADVLNRLGIRNVSVVGCPSLLSLTRESLDALVRRRPSVDSLAVNFTASGRGSHAIDGAAMTETENALFARAMRDNAYFVLQNEGREIEMLAAREAGDVEAEKAWVRQTSFVYKVPLSALPELGAYLRERLRIFFSVPEWRDWMATMTASVGTRFHGNVAALLAGTPALFLAHDYRTREMSELMRVPHLVLDRAYTPDEIVERLLAVDYAPFVRQFASMLVEWRLFLARNGLEFVPAEGASPVEAAAPAVATAS